MHNILGGKPLIDKLDSAVPNWSTFTRGFQKIVELSMTPQWHKRVWSDGGHFRRRGDFREITDGDFPVILHQANKHDHRADDKIELVETGGMSMLRMVSTLANVYDRDALDNRILRLDLAADVPGVPVEWFRDNVDVRMKQTMREWQQVTLSNRRAEQISAGRKPNQIRVYDKTAHRRFLLAAAKRKMPKEEREWCHFEDWYGYPETKIVTRVERQIAAHDVQKFGTKRVRDIYKVGSKDPFRQLIFPEDIPQRGDSFEERGDPLRIVFREWIRAETQRQGITLTKNKLWRMCRNRDQFYRVWNRYRDSAQPVEGAKVTRSNLLEFYRASIDAQLTKAA